MKAKLPMPENEVQRLKALDSYHIMDSEMEVEFDRLTELASLICGVPITLVSLIDANRQWFKSRVGLDAPETPRDISFCQYAITVAELFEVEDALNDDRFKNNPLVQGDPNIRFYAGQPLIDPEGYALGTLCVIDRVPRKLDAAQRRALEILAIEVTAQIVARKHTQEARKMEELFELSIDMICIAGTDGFFKKINGAFAVNLGWKKEDLLGKPFADFIHPDDVESTFQEVKKLSEGFKTINFINRYRTSSGDYKTLQWFTNPDVKTGELFAIARDVSDRVEMEHIMQQNQDRLNEAQRMSQVGSWEYNLLTSEQWWSSEHYRIFEIDEPQTQEVLHQKYRARIHPDDLMELDRVIQNTLQTGEGFTYPHRVLLPDGRIKHVLGIGKPVRNSKGELTSVVGTVQDVSKQRQAELEILATKNLLEETSQVARVGGWEYDLITDKLTWSNITKKILEVSYDFEPNLSSAINFYKDGKSRDAITQKIQEAIECGTPFDVDLQLETAKGNTIWVKTIGKVQAQGSKWVRVYGTFQDISEQVQNQETIRLYDERWKFALEGSGDGIWDWDIHKNTVFTSEQWKIMLGYKGAEVGNDATVEWVDRLHPEDKERTFYELNRCLKGEIPFFSVEYRFRCKDGSYKWILDRGKVIGCDENGKALRVVGTHADISEQKRIEAEILKAKEIAVNASKSKSEFLANMSHEIRTPLNGVIGFSDLLMKSQLDSTQQIYMSNVYRSATALLDIINDILDFSKIEAGLLELSIDKTHLGDLASESTQIISYQTQSKKLALKTTLAPDVNCLAMSDTLRLRQILINLLGNAVKFTEAGEIELKIESLSTDAKSSLYRFSVRDTGIGIDPKSQQKIFEAFAQEDSSTTRKYGGTGLGLSISNKLLALMNSRLQLTSKPGFGSTFFFELELKNYTEKTKGIEVKDEGKVNITVDAHPFQNAEEIHILLVDDNEVNVFLAKTILKKIHPKARITTALNGEEAVAAFSREVAKIIFMDVQMPVMNGYEATKAIRAMAQGKDVPIVALTAGTVKGEIEQCFEVGMSDYVSKPYVKDTIEKVMTKWLATTR